MEECFRDTVEIYRRLDLQTEDIDSWPEPEKNRYHTYHLKTSVPLSLRALEVIQSRTDINWIHVNLHVLFDDIVREKLEALFSTNDRSWSVSLEHSERFDPKIDNAVSLKRALAILGNVRYLNFLFDSRDMTKPILDALPVFKYLQSLHLGDYETLPAKLIPLSQYSFAPQLDGIQLNIFSVSAEQASDITSRLHGDIHAMIVVEQVPEGVIGFATSQSVLLALDCVKEVRLRNYSEFPFEEAVTPVGDWLRCPRCSVTQLELLLGEDDEHDLSTMLDLIPVIPKLKLLRLNMFPSKLETILPFLPQSPLLEKIVWLGEDCDDDECKAILAFQLSSRPRLLSFKLTTREDTEKLDDPQEGFDAENVHRVSLIFETLQSFRRCKLQASLPLSTWPNILESLGSATFACSSRAVHCAGIDASFEVIQEIFGDPHRLVLRAAAASGSDCSRSKRRREG